jgi:hypothetical protein
MQFDTLAYCDRVRCVRAAVTWAVTRLLGQIISGGDTSVALAVASAVRLLDVAYIVTFCLSHRHRLAGSGFHRFGCGAAADRFPKTFSDVHTFAHLHVMCAGIVARVGRSVW